MASPADRPSSSSSSRQLSLLLLLAQLPGVVQCQDSCPPNILVAAVLGTFFSTIVAVLLVLLIIYLVHRRNNTNKQRINLAASSSAAGNNEHQLEEKQVVGLSVSSQPTDLRGHGQHQVAAWAITLTQAECTQKGYPGFVMCREYAPLQNDKPLSSGTTNAAFQQ